ncbi:MAG: 2-C-methyl-D-erythritol 4-phosphate cytidylyltransferase [Actinomycetota bacterium]|jgi:2-C-methyl-D-erythritol 4-phosphate cytidylyltransferase|nr:2-C-methyl-D-erythritol 4-phosphate cytidylyltransferase [Actinomycetota bacterium]
MKTVTVWGIVVAGGRGSRFGAAKQFARLAGATVLERSLATTARVCDGVVVALPAESGWQPQTPIVAVAGGETRADSVRAALAAVPLDADVIVVHDAARPLASPMLFAAVIAAVRAGADAAVPGLPVSDTLKRVAGDLVIETVPRDGLVAVQTPQAFGATALRRAHERGGDASDDAMLVEQGGGVVRVVAGEIRNLKITVPDDLEVAAGMIEVI